MIHDAIANYLSSSLRFHDEKQKPSVNTVRDLMQLVKFVLKNARVMDCIQGAEMLWGRDTLFDDYTKLTALVKKSRSSDDLAFMVELVFVRMKLSVNISGGQTPENPTRSSLQSKAGEIAQAQATRDAFTWLKKFGGETWAAHSPVIDDLLRPKVVN